MSKKEYNQSLRKGKGKGKINNNVRIENFLRHWKSTEHISRKGVPPDNVHLTHDNHHSFNLKGKDRSKSVETVKMSLSHFIYSRDNPEIDTPTHNLRCFNIVKSRAHWSTVERKLNTLRFKLLDSGEEVSSFRALLRTAIRSYCEEAAFTNFGLLDDNEIASKLGYILPGIVDMALDHPNLFVGGIPYLEKGDNATISISRKFCASLLANAFLCTVPEENRIASSGESFPSINFYGLFNTQNINAMRYSMRKEKLTCLLNYFEIRQDSTDDDFEMISFQRKCIRRHIEWKNCDKALCKIQVTKIENIEDAVGKLQVDFANRVIGGGVLSNGCVQEEIRFSAFPELILARLFTEPLADDEVMVISGVKRYSEYSGYSKTFKCLGPVQKFKEEGQGHRVVAMDATYFRNATYLKSGDSHLQYTKIYIDRELHKALVGFSPNYPSDRTAIATGNWGCGAFNGDPQLKCLIQWMAASANRREYIQYHTFGNEKQSEEIKKISECLLSKKVTVGSLYRTLIEYSMEDGRNMSVFEYVCGGNAKKKGGDLCSII